MANTFLLISTFFIIFLHASVILGDNLDPVSELDIDAYLGLWLSAYISKDLWPGQESSYCVRAKYDLKSENIMHATNEYNQGEVDGPVKGIMANLIQSEDPSIPGSFELKVKPIKLAQISAEYRIIQVGEKDEEGKYPWAVVYGPSIETIFVIYRQDIDFTKPGNSLTTLVKYLNSLPLTPRLEVNEADIVDSIQTYQPKSCDYEINLAKYWSDLSGTDE